MAACLALASGAALADGVALFRKAPPALAASTASRIKSEHPTKSVAAVDPDPNAINATVINVQLDGKTYRFVGAKRNLGQGVKLREDGKPVPDGEDGGDFWEGKTAAGERAWIGNSKLGVVGEFSTAGKTYRLIRVEGKSVLTEVAFLPTPASYDEPTPEQIEVWRKHDERNKGVRP